MAVDPKWGSYYVDVISKQVCRCVMLCYVGDYITDRVFYVFPERQNAGETMSNFSRIWR